MATVKLQDGKVITKDGMVSCDCCSQCQKDLWTQFQTFQIDQQYINVIDKDVLFGKLLLQGGTWRLDYNIDCHITQRVQMAYVGNPSQTLLWDYDIKFNINGSRETYREGNCLEIFAFEPRQDGTELPISPTIDLIIPSSYQIDSTTYPAATRSITPEALQSAWQIVYQVIDFYKLESGQRVTRIYASPRFVVSFLMKTVLNPGSSSEISEYSTFGFVYGSRARALGDIFSQNITNLQDASSYCLFLDEPTEIYQCAPMFFTTGGQIDTFSYNPFYASALVQGEWSFTPSAP